MAEELQQAQERIRDSHSQVSALEDAVIQHHRRRAELVARLQQLGRRPPSRPVPNQGVEATRASVLAEQDAYGSEMSDSEALMSCSSNPAPRYEAPPRPAGVPPLTLDLLNGSSISHMLGVDSVAPTDC